MKIYSVKLTTEEYETGTNLSFEPVCFLSKLEPLDVKELDHVNELRNKCFHYPQTLTLSRVKKTLKAFEELEQRAKSSPADNWKHWGYEKGRAKWLKDAQKVKEILFEAMDILEV